ACFWRSMQATTRVRWRRRDTTPLPRNAASGFRGIAILFGRVPTPRARPALMLSSWCGGGEAPDDRRFDQELEPAVDTGDCATRDQFLEHLPKRVVERGRGLRTHVGPRKAPLGVAGLDVLVDSRLPRVGAAVLLAEFPKEMAPGQLVDQVDDLPNSNQWGL